jgi:ABC-type multidrug transport system ATPase subunit
MHKAIESTGISKKFGNTLALNNVTFSVDESEIFGFIGPDGAGKTTLFRIIATLLLPDDGDMKILGLDCNSDFKVLRKNIGYMPGRFSLYQDLSVEENLTFYATVFGTTVSENYNLISDIYSHIEPFRKRLAGKLSGGMKQKLALACTLIHTPELLLLDEPTTGVDPVSRRDFWKVLANLLRTGMTVVMTTPYLDEAERCNRVTMMSAGKNLITDTPAALKKVMKGDIVEIVCEDVRGSFSRVQSLPLVKEAQAFGDRLNVLVESAGRDMPVLLNTMKEEKIAVQTWRVVPPSLENVFISLMGGPPA